MVSGRHPIPLMPVHPHGRGDNEVQLAPLITSDGSPPRAWGQWRFAVAGGVQVRFTPTGVGTIVEMTPPAQRTSVHPHGRGDNSLWRGGGQWLDGSPPRAWGQC